MSPMILFVVDCAAKATVLLAVAWLVTRLLRRSTAANRHLVWLAAYVSILALPLAEALIPGRLILSIPEAKHVTPVAAPSADYQLPVVSAAATKRLLSSPSVASMKVDTPVLAPAPASKPSPWIYLGALWGLGAALVALQWLVGVVSTHANRIAVGSPELRSLAENAGVHRPVRVRLARAPRPGYALTYGVLRPIILLPKSAGFWPPQRLRSVLLHELAHIRRLDWLSQTLASLACALHWFNPLAWIGIRALRAEAEAATDDFVLNLGCPPSAYARDLLEVAAELSHRHALMPTTGVTVMKSPHIEHRIQAILDKSRNRRGATVLEALWIGGLALAVLTPLSISKLGSSSQSKVASKAKAAAQHAKKPTVHVIRNGAIVLVQVDDKRYRILNQHRGKVKIVTTDGKEVLQVGSKHYRIVEGRDHFKIVDPYVIRDQEKAKLLLLDAEKAQVKAATVQRLNLDVELQQDKAQQEVLIAQSNAEQAKAMSDSKGQQDKAVEIAISKAKLQEAQAEYQAAAQDKVKADLLYKEGSAPKVARDAVLAKAEIELDVQTKQAAKAAAGADATTKAMADELSLEDKDTDRKVLRVVTADQVAALVKARGGTLVKEDGRDTVVVLTAESSASIQKAQADLEAARAKLIGIKKRFQQGAVSKAEFDSAQKDLTIAELNLKIAKLEARGKN